MASVNGSTNRFPEGQCTYWATERYHQLTQYWVPFNGNAYQWATNCLAFGWVNSAKPVVPSICCLQPNVQLASSLGHVAVVESINSDGTVVTSNLNWGPNPSQVTNITFRPGSGVSFIYAVDSKGAPIAQQSSPNPFKTLASSITGTGDSRSPVIFQLAPNASVTAFLTELDLVLVLTNPFDVNAQQDTIGIPPVSISFTDPVDWLHGVGVNLFDDLVSIMGRFIFLSIGLFIVFKVIGNFIDYGKVADSAASIGKLAALIA